MKRLFKSTFNTILLVTFGLIFTGCGIPSVHPLYEASDLKKDDSLNGVWQRSDSDTRYHIMRIGDLDQHLRAEGDTTSSIKVVKPDDLFTGEVEMEQGIFTVSNDLIDRGLENLYLVQSESDRTDLYLVGVVELGGDRYLDFKRLSFNLDPFNFPVHLFMKTSISGNTLTMHMFSENWLKEQIKNRQIRIKYEENDEENYILTAPTSELKKFVEKYGQIEEAYRNTRTYSKVSTNPVFSFEELEDVIEEE